MAVQRVQCPVSFQYLNAGNQLIPIPAGTSLSIIDRNTSNPATCFAAFTGVTTITSPATDNGGNVPGYFVEGSYAITASANLAATPPFAGATINWEAVRGDGVENYFPGSVNATALASGAVGPPALTTPVNQALAPTGAIFDFAGPTAPAGYHLCDGSVQAQSGTFGNLFAVIGSTYNTGGEGVGNFRLPNTQGRFSLGAGSGIGGYTNPGNVGGALGHVHNHSTPSVTINLGTPTVSVTVPSLPIPNHVHGLSANGGSEFNMSFNDSTHINLLQGDGCNSQFNTTRIAAGVPDNAWKAISIAVNGAALYGLTDGIFGSIATSATGASGNVNGGQTATGNVNGGQNTLGSDPAYLTLNKIIKL